MFLPDINVWIGLSFDSHLHHPSSLAWWKSTRDEVAAFNRMTQQGYFRLGTDRRVIGPRAFNMTEAWQTYDDFMNDPRITYVQEPVGIDRLWRSLTSTRAYSHKLWNDAYLAAFAIAGGYEFVTFDQGFRQFPGLQCTFLQ